MQIGKGVEVMELNKSEFKVNEDLFGRYCEIEQGFSNEKHIYKIINTFRSNAYKDTPLRYNSEQYIHDEIVQVLTVVHCGIDETKCERVALKDVELLPSKYISKDKIREKIELIKTLRQAFYNEANVITILQDLLKEE